MTPQDLRSWRERLSLSQAEAAVLLDISKDTMSDYEGGRRGGAAGVPRVIAYACHWISMMQAVNRHAPWIATDEARILSRELQYSLSLPAFYSGPGHTGEFESNHALHQHTGQIPKDEPSLMQMLFPRTTIAELRRMMYTPPRQQPMG